MTTARPLHSNDLAPLGWSIDHGLNLYNDDRDIIKITAISEFRKYPTHIFTLPIHTIDILIIVDELGTPWLSKSSLPMARNILKKLKNGTLGMPLSTYLTIEYM